MWLICLFIFTRLWCRISVESPKRDFWGFPTISSTLYTVARTHALDVSRTLSVFAVCPTNEHACPVSRYTTNTYLYIKYKYVYACINRAKHTAKHLSYTHLLLLFPPTLGRRVRPSTYFITPSLRVPRRKTTRAHETHYALYNIVFCQFFADSFKGVFLSPCLTQLATEW